MNIKRFIFFIVMAVLLLGVVALWFISAQSSQKDSQQAAIDEAVEWRRSSGNVMICIQVITDAVHTATGARYTFSDGCLPPGWVANESDLL